MKNYLKTSVRFFTSRIRDGRLRDMRRQTLWIYQYAKRYWLVMIFYTLLGMFGTTVGLLTSIVSRDLVDLITGHASGEIIQTFAILIGLNIGTTLIGQISDYASHYLSMKVDAEIKADIFSKILVTDWESLTSYHTGDLLTRWGSDASNISSGVLNFIPNAVIYLFRFASAFAMVLYHDATFALFAFLGMPVSLLLSKTLLRRMVSNNQRSAAMGAKMSGFNQEAFSNIQTIKAFDLIRLYCERLKQLQKESITMRLDFQKMSMGTSLLLSAAGLFVSYLSYGWGIYRVFCGAISYGTMTMFLSLSGTLTGALHSLTSLVPTVISLTTSAGRLMDIIEMPREDFSGSSQAEHFYEKHRADGISLCVDQVSYAYQNGTQVFLQASLEAHPHEVVALVGPSGEGKTTMIRLLLALIRPQSGTVFFHGAQDADSSLLLTPAARRLFSYVPQGNTMFSGTIAENMRSVKPDASDAEITSALRLACAWEFVQKLPDGINSMIKERGGGFSEGQAQRLSIARALLRQAPILLLDEATSALDSETEKNVLRNILQDNHPRTCIVTTHRPSVLTICRRVYAIREKQCIALTTEEIAQLIQTSTAVRT